MIHRVPYWYASYLPLGWEYAKFCASGGSRLLLNIALLTVIVETGVLRASLAPFLVAPILLIVGYVMTNYWVFNTHDDPAGGTGHLSRGLLWYGSLWTGKAVNYGIYVALIWLTPTPYQLAWIAGAIIVSPYTFIVNRWFWSTEVSIRGWFSRRQWLSRFYDRHVRRWVPTRAVEIDGVTVLASWFESPRPEESVRDAIDEAVEPGDHVVIVGGGYGFSTVAAAKHGAHVTVFEASASLADRLRRVALLNDVIHQVTVEHARVAGEGRVYGRLGGATQVPASMLPSCDVLVLDCEGAEQRVLTGYQHRPRAIVVETHGFLDAPTTETLDILDGIGYHERWTRYEHDRRDVAVILGERSMT